MIFIIGWILHIFGQHTPKPYTTGEDPKIEDDEFICMICNKVFKY